jgi:hypothetical protein
MTFQSLDDLYAPLYLVIDPAFAQVMVTVSTGVNGDLAVPDAKISTAPAVGMQTVIYDTAAGGFSDTTGKTGPLGMGIMVNANAVGIDYPGKWFPLYVTIGGNVHPFQPPIPFVRGAVTRVYFIQGGLEGNP